ncbi:MAG: pyridoxamine 5'-phosphate oxidase [Bdellovibrionales bacterium]|jgi:pyridoxamine 5'-phosphate oxidase|nr:pyridoxamine 5'-phosphate oxidase [Bdellovibrionales bacterium]
MELKPIQDGPLLIPDDPIEGIQQWVEAAKEIGQPEHTAMTLATVSTEGKPAARIVLLKGFSTAASGAAKGRAGVEFYTNYESRKSHEMTANPNVALVFHWVMLRRQIRIEGVVSKVTPEESDRYFQTRPRESQIGAWASKQSQVIQSREELVQRVDDARARFGDDKIPCPPNWGGWRLIPSRVEFWEERPFRLHERHVKVYDSGTGSWRTERLAP